MTVALLAAALAVFLWPTKPPSPAYLNASTPATPAPPPGPPTYHAAIHALVTVRARLSATEHLTDATKAAVDTLTLALVAGSDATP